MTFWSKTKKIWVIIFATAAFLFVIFQVLTSNQTISFNNKINSSPFVTQEKKQFVKVVYVIDGDTIMIEGNKKVRFIGIDAPEIKTKKTEGECFAEESKTKNKDLIQEKKVYLEKDISETDKYGRLLRYVYLEDGIFLNDLLVRQGFAKTTPIAPDIKYASRFWAAEQEARKNNLGLWGICR